MLLLADDPFPNFHCRTTLGEFDIKDYIKDSWCLFLSHPCDFTPVCTTELAKAGTMFQEFQKRGVKVLALSCCDLDMHNEWIKDLKALGKLEGMEYPIPIIADQDRNISCMLGMIRPEDKDVKDMPITCRKLFLIDPHGKIKFETLYPANAGRNFDEILRVIDALQIASKHPVEMPADWRPGDRCVSVPSLSVDEIKKQLPQGVEDVSLPSGKNYMRLTQVS